MQTKAAQRPVPDAALPYPGYAAACTFSREPCLLPRSSFIRARTGASMLQWPSLEGEPDMRDAQQWFDAYGQDHQNPTNRAIHWVCVPVILWCVIAGLWLIPIPPMLGRQGFWAAAVMFFSFVFYYRISRAIGLGMVLVFVVFGLATEALYRRLGPVSLGELAAALFVLAWIGQFVGHKIEGHKPSFLTDLTYLLIGPAWLLGKLMRRVGLRY
jgi:uncharacterized membrane protein YGL010W